MIQSIEGTSAYNDEDYVVAWKHSTREYILFISH